MVKAVDGPYSYDTTRPNGPRSWSSVDEEFSACGAGEIQSPINFPAAVGASPLADGPQPKLVRANYTLGSGSWNWALACHEERACGYTMFAGKKWYVIQTHFHHPSEHTLMEKRFPLESHTVHQSEDGNLAVIATVFDYPPEADYPSTIKAAHNMDYGVNPYLKEVLEGITQDKGTFEIDPMAIIDPSQGFCSYTGSLTTPPCTEGVTFLMQMNIATVSRRQVHDYALSAGMPRKKIHSLCDFYVSQASASSV
ncbi:carbonic anhydrase [Chondrus crispus]|uniref:carbonic anhydrase n=1 Tax=Chondrus crispus TaxID=2769 RepID=R7QGM2_CHOCR|nr:carbonic anhydrase [Chondrus crispus]CDF36550.1 carbonic anhydrase [Chondrus crispus]|eukprot:XP_005716369.1 carbonic anhydrase [Chondrus crispus]